MEYVAGLIFGPDSPILRGLPAMDSPVLRSMPSVASALLRMSYSLPSLVSGLVGGLGGSALRIMHLLGSHFGR